jgi:hypothetical protein
VFVAGRQPIVVARPLRRRKGVAITLHGYFPPPVITFYGSRGRMFTYNQRVGRVLVYRSSTGASDQPDDLTGRVRTYISRTGRSQVFHSNSGRIIDGLA